MSPNSASIQRWRAVALTGGILVAIGAAVACLDLASLRFRFEFIDVNYGYVAFMVLVGILGSFIGCIGWARHLERSGRAAMGWLVFAVPLVLLVVGNLIDGLNVHGSFGLVFFLCIPAVVLAIILWIMAVMKPSARPAGHV